MEGSGSTEAQLRSVLERYATPLPAEIDSKIEKLHQLAVQTAAWSHEMNLTGFREPGEVVDRLVVPPICWFALLPEPETVVDLGSGAGYPSFPLAICWPETRFLLIEARRRRHHFQRHLVRELKLQNAELLHGRAEQLDPVQADVVIAQAFAPLSEAVFHMKRWARAGGILAIPQHNEVGPVEDPDLEWIGCPSYTPPRSARSFLWISKKKR